MSSFAMVLLEDGVEMELPSDLSGIISLLDQEVPKFSCQGHGYRVTSGKGTLGTRWELMVKSVDLSNEDLPLAPVGRIELEKLDDGMVQFRVPPRFEQDSRELRGSDPDGRFFGSFIYQMLNTLQRHRLIELPGVLPTV